MSETLIEPQEVGLPAWVISYHDDLGMRWPSSLCASPLLSQDPFASSLAVRCSPHPNPAAPGQGRQAPACTPGQISGEWQSVRGKDRLPGKQLKPVSLSLHLDKETFEHYFGLATHKGRTSLGWPLCRRPFAAWPAPCAELGPAVRGGFRVPAGGRLAGCSSRLSAGWTGAEFPAEQSNVTQRVPTSGAWN